MGIVVGKFSALNEATFIFVYKPIAHKAQSTNQNVNLIYLL
jgi:hypothetical protein